MNMPSPDELTESDREAIARIVKQADGLADRILAVEVPAIDVYQALHGIVALGNGSGWFTPSVLHQRALRRLPGEADLKLWVEQERRMAALR